ncbi:hypothetical protein [Neomicrococcus aestuarii]|uniref:Uncharacterized protein n=1 Tax=Neomicrococcus aestuarii TaxID=556325 RepID=A0A1L2ZMJ4_9MICC|nr:hypothetical protein [Neomicrococcus aestuarii]APF40242.1 hypothetical protein BHE16_03515 [Neomicrococcus aestuarii]
MDVIAYPEDGRASLVDLREGGRKLLASASDGLANSDDGIEDGVELSALIEVMDRLIVIAERYYAGKETAR